MVHLMVLLMVLPMVLPMVLLMVLLMVLNMGHHMVIMVISEVQTMGHGEMGQEDRIMEIMGMETEGETSKVTSGVEEVVVVDLNKIEKKIPEEENKIQS